MNQPRLKTKGGTMANNDRHYAICPICSQRFYIQDKKRYVLSKWVKLKNGNAKKFFCSIKCYNSKIT